MKDCKHDFTLKRIEDDDKLLTLMCVDCGHVEEHVEFLGSVLVKKEGL